MHVINMIIHENYLLTVLFMYKVYYIF